MFVLMVAGVEWIIGCIWRNDSMTFARVCVFIVVCAALMSGGYILEDTIDSGIPVLGFLSGICITILLAQNGII